MVKFLGHYADHTICKHEDKIGGANECCERGVNGCLDMNCGCVPSPYYWLRNRNAQAYHRERLAKERRELANLVINGNQCNHIWDESPDMPMFTRLLCNAPDPLSYSARLDVIFGAEHMVKVRKRHRRNLFRFLGVCSLLFGLILYG